MRVECVGGPMDGQVVETQCVEFTAHFFEPAVLGVFTEGQAVKKPEHKTCVYQVMGDGTAKVKR